MSKIDRPIELRRRGDIFQYVDGNFVVGFTIPTGAGWYGKPRGFVGVTRNVLGADEALLHGLKDLQIEVDRAPIRYLTDLLRGRTEEAVTAGTALYGCLPSLDEGTVHMLYFVSGVKDGQEVGAYSIPVSVLLCRGQPLQSNGSNISGERLQYMLVYRGGKPSFAIFPRNDTKVGITEEGVIAQLVTDIKTRFGGSLANLEVEVPHYSKDGSFEVVEVNPATGIGLTSLEAVVDDKHT